MTHAMQSTQAVRSIDIPHAVAGVVPRWVQRLRTSPGFPTASSRNRDPERKWRPARKSPCSRPSMRVIVCVVASRYMPPVACTCAPPVAHSASRRAQRIDVESGAIANAYPHACGRSPDARSRCRRPGQGNPDRSAHGSPPRSQFHQVLDFPSPRRCAVCGLRWMALSQVRFGDGFRKFLQPRRCWHNGRPGCRDRAGRASRCGPEDLPSWNTEVRLPGWRKSRRWQRGPGDQPRAHGRPPPRLEVAAYEFAVQ